MKNSPKHLYIGKHTLMRSRYRILHIIIIIYKIISVLQNQFIFGNSVINIVIEYNK